jgi:hypothetical protein
MAFLYHICVGTYDSRSATPCLIPLLIRLSTLEMIHGFARNFGDLVGTLSHTPKLHEHMLTRAQPSELCWV